METSRAASLPRSTPEQQGITSTAILAFVRALQAEINEVHSVMLLRHGHVIAEGWWHPYAPDHPRLVFSLSKSFTSTAVGLALDEGRFALDDSVLFFFPDEAPDADNALWAKLQVRHLLAMATGQAEDTWSTMVDRPDGDWIKGFLSVPLAHEPGTHFVYNTGATYMLSAIVQRCTGMTLLDYLQPRLFAPLGIAEATWQASPQGITAGGIGLSITTEAIARFGQLYLQGGAWQGAQLLPADWVSQATSFQISNSNGVQPDWSQGYGYQFWRCRHNAYRGDGVFGQYCVVLPEQDAVLAITSGMDVFDMQQPLELVWDLLLPAMTPDPLPADAAAHAQLSDALNDLALPPVAGAASSPLASQLSGNTYAVDPNEMGIESIAFDFTDSPWTLTFKIDGAEETIACGHGDWPHSHTRLFKQPQLFEHAKVAVSGAWTADSTFPVVFRLYETPFYYTMHCHVADDELLIEIQVNVSLESTAPVVMAGKIVETQGSQI